MQGSKAFNHHPIMGASISNSWARGFPLDLLQDRSTQGDIAYQTDIPFLEKIGVIQYLADVDPDVDAIHRLTKPLPMSFNNTGPPMLVPSHAYNPYNAQATIHAKNAFWALLLPSTVARTSVGHLAVVFSPVSLCRHWIESCLCATCYRADTK